MILALVGGTFATYKIAAAKFIVNSDHTFALTGEITDTELGDNTLMVDTVGTVPTKITVNSDTVWEDGLTFTTLPIGEKVSIRGTKVVGENTRYATVIKKVSTGGAGYGNGHVVMLDQATLQSKTHSSMVVREAFHPITVNVTTATVFVGGKTFSQLNAGDKLRIYGKQTSAGFNANTVVFIK